MAPEKSPAKKERFEDQLKVVEEVVKALESGKLGLEESLEKYEAGIAALRSCYRILEEAERKIQVLVKEKDGALTARELDAEPKSGRHKQEGP
jgi:exodeoxyribonuclease VII small subunit